MIPIVDVGLAEAVKEGRVRVVPALTGFQGSAAWCSTTASRVELVRRHCSDGDSAPGSSRSSGTSASSTGTAGRSCATSRQPAGVPGLHFVGFEVTLGGTLRRAGIEAKQLARAVLGAGRARAQRLSDLRADPGGTTPRPGAR